MQINLPILLLILPGLFAIITFLLSRWTVAQAILGGLACLILALLVQQVPLQNVVLFAGRELRLITSWSIFGRSFVFNPEDRSTLVFLFLAAGMLISAAAATRVPGTFVPTALSMLPLLSATVFIEPFLYAAIFLELAAVISVFMLANTEQWQTRGALRLLVFVTLGMPFILLAGWQLEALLVSPDNQSALNIAAMLLTLGCLICLAVFPFHAWVPEVAEHSSPLPVAFVLGVFPSAVILFMLNALNDLEWLRFSSLFYSGVRWGGVALAIAGGVFSLGQKNFGRLMGYAALIDYGASLLAISLLANGASQQIVATVIAILLTRIVSMGLWAIGLGILRQTGNADFESLRSKARQYPLSTMAMLFGGLSALGFPLTVGFPARWTLLIQLAQNELLPSIVLLAGSLCVLLGYARGIFPLLAPPASEISEEELEPVTTSIFALLGVLGILALGLFPQWLFSLTSGLANAFTKLSGN